MFSNFSFHDGQTNKRLEGYEMVIGQKSPLMEIEKDELEINDGRRPIPVRVIFNKKKEKHF